MKLRQINGQNARIFSFPKQHLAVSNVIPNRIQGNSRPSIQIIEVVFIQHKDTCGSSIVNGNENKG